VDAIGDRPLDAARSNRWIYRKQHSFFATLRRPPNHPVVARNKPRNQGGKRDLSSERIISAFANGIELFVREIRQPSLFIAGSQDAVITGLIGAKRVNALERVLPNLTRAR
jgi:hypothetical protein